MKVKKTLIEMHEKGILYKIKQKKEKYILKKEKHVLCGEDSRIINNHFEGCNFIGDRCHVTNSRIGYGTYINEDGRVFNAFIGRYTSIAVDFRTVGGNHPISEFVSTSPIFFSTTMGKMLSYVDKEYFNPFKYANSKKNTVVIGNDVWIGASVKIMQGVTIGDGAIIGAGAVVTKDVEPYAIYVGIPAKKIGQRFEKNVIESLLKIKWWNKGEKWIMKNAELFSDPKAFLASLEK